MTKHVVILAGDGIGPEIMAEAEKVLAKVNETFALDLSWSHELLGGCAIVLSSWTAARVTFTGRAQSAEAALLRLIAGMLLKWFVVIAVLLLGTLSLKLAPLYVLIGLVVGLLAQFLVAMKR